MAFRGRRRFRRFRRSTKVAPKVKRYVRKAIAKNQENKYSNLNLTSTFSSVGNTWVETDLTAISQGTGVSNRIGHQVKTKAFYIRGTLVGGQSNLATDDNRNTFRIVLALWDSTVATPLASNGADLSSYIARQSTVGRGLIKKYMDKVIELPTQGRDSTGYLPAIRQIRKFIKCPAFIRYYGSVAGNDNRKLILSMISDSGAVSHPGFTQGQYTLFYEDA